MMSSAAKAAERATEKAISLLSVSTTFDMSPDPKICPIMMATTDPMEIVNTLNRLVMVPEMLKAATTARPLVE